MELFQSPFFSLFFIIAIGFIIGNIKIKGFSFDISAILFLAIFMGYLGVELPHEFQVLGLILFIYSIGIQAGPGFFASFKKQGRQLFLMALILIGSAVVVTQLVTNIFDIDKNIAVGLLTGALTSTPGLAAAIDSTSSPLASIGYGIAYPFGVIGVIIFVKLLPKLLRLKITDAEKAYEKQIKESHPELFFKTFIVENPKAAGKSIGELKIRRMTGAVISRVQHNDKTFTPTPKTVLNTGDKLRIVGPMPSFTQIETILGREINEDIPLSKEYRVQSILVTNTEAVNKTLRQINLFRLYGATVTRIRRSGINFSPSPNFVLQMGDKLVVACSKENMKNVAALFGNNDKKLSDTDFLPIAVGIVLGIIAGKLSIGFSSELSFSPGLTGGVLFVSLILGRLGRTGPVLWSMTGAATQLLRQLGLLFFLATVGTQAGSTLLDTFSNYGFELLLAGAFITLIPMFITAIVSKWLLKLNLLDILGALTGGMTSTPGLAAIDSMTESEAPKLAYATIYPIAIVLLIISLQLLI